MLRPGVGGGLGDALRLPDGERDVLRERDGLREPVGVMDTVLLLGKGQRNPAR
ncbi:hypothetical protein GCM10022248_56490 [Nonomuraea soli]